jgi:hypothetical protein
MIIVATILPGVVGGTCPNMRWELGHAAVWRRGLSPKHPSRPASMPTKLIASARPRFFSAPFVLYRKTTPCDMSPKAEPKKKGKQAVSKTGTKMCQPCGKVHDICEFPPGKAMCLKAFNGLRNLKATAIAQGQGDWWEEINADPAKLKAVLNAYFVRISPEVTGLSRAKRNAFCIAQYQDANASCRFRLTRLSF